MSNSFCGYFNAGRENARKIICTSLLYLFRFFLATFLFLGLACSKDSESEPEVVLAKIGDRTITKNDFIRRTEFTIVPGFHAKTPLERSQFILSNLIMEKVFACEIGEDNELSRNEIFQLRMKGIKEQNMREQLYNSEVYNKVKIDSAELSKVFSAAGREYELEFFSISSDTIARKVSDVLETVPDSLKDAAFDDLRAYAVPGKKTITYKDSESWPVHRAIFSEPLNVGRIIGPVKIEKNSYLVMKVLKWKNYPAVTETEVDERMAKVREKLTNAKADAMGREYVAGIMKGRKINFNGKIFKRVVDLYYPLFVSEGNQKNQELSKTIDEEIQSGGNTFLSEIVFTVDDKPWTVDDFRKAVISRPLFIEKQEYNKYQFQRHFQQKVIDLIQDHFLTKEAYKKGLDKNSFVVKQAQMWRDANLALFQKKQIQARLAGHDSSFDRTKVSMAFSKYIDSLQTKYSRQIVINEDVLRQIKLTNVPMYSWKTNVPFPAVSPPFLQLVNDSNLDYARPEVGH